MEGSPELLVALELSLLCLQVATFPDSLGALEMYSCARRNYALPLLNPSFSLSLVCDRFSVDLFPGGGSCASTTLLASTESLPPSPSAPFSVPLYSLIKEEVTSRGDTGAQGSFVYKSKEKALVKYLMNPSTCVPCGLTVVPHLIPPLRFLFLDSLPTCCILSLVNLSVL